MGQINISKHAVNRYRERVIGCPLVWRPDTLLRIAMIIQIKRALRGAKPKDGDKIDIGVARLCVDKPKRGIPVITTVLTFEPQHRRWRRTPR